MSVWIEGDEIISTLLEICEKESIPSAVFSGIGGCQSAELQVFIPETGTGFWEFRD